MPSAQGGGSLVTGSNIVDGTIADADVATNAAIARSKLSGVAASGANSDITSLTGLTTPLAQAYGGTGQDALVKKVSLTAQNIKDMFATPIVVVAGQTGKIPLVLHTLWYFRYGTVQFANGGTLRVQEETSAVSLGSGLGAADVNAAADKILAQLSSANVVRVSGKGLCISNQTAAFITGDGTLDVYITYAWATL